MQTLNVNKKDRPAKVRVELTEEELDALWQAVRDYDRYADFWNASVQSKLYSGMTDAINALSVVPQGCESNIVG